MQVFKTLFLVFLTAILIGSVSLVAEGEKKAVAKVIIIVNSGLKDEGATLVQVKKIYLGKMRKWSKGKVKPCGLKRGDTHKEFLATYVGKTSSQYNSLWKKIIFSGKGAPPKKFRTEEEVVKYVKATKGAIGYIKSTTAHDGVIEVK